MTETPYVLWKASFTMPLEGAINPLYPICRMPNLIGTPSESCIYTLTVDLNTSSETITFHPYLKVDPDNIHIVHAQLQRIPGYEGFVPIQDYPGDEFFPPLHPTIISFENMDFAWFRPFDVLGKVVDITGLKQDVTGWFWNFDLMDYQGNRVKCWYRTFNEEGLKEGAKLKDIEEEDPALCVNVSPQLVEDGICIHNESELLIFKE